MSLVCYLPIEYLSVETETKVFGVRLLPLSDTRIPPADTWFRLEHPVACVAAVEVRGTDERMVERSRAQAAHALRLLRVTLREHPSIHNWHHREGVSPGRARRPRQHRIRCQRPAPPGEHCTHRLDPPAEATQPAPHRLGRTAQPGSDPPMPRTAAFAASAEPIIAATSARRTSISTGSNT